MEPVTASGACFTIAKLAVEAGHDLTVLIQKYRSVPEVLRSLDQQLKLIKAYNTRLGQFLSNDSTLLNADEIDLLKESLAECEDIIQSNIQQHVSDASKSLSAKNVFTRVKYLWNEESMREAENRLKSQLSAQQQLLQISQLSAVDRPAKRNDATTKSVLVMAKASASIYSGRDKDSILPAARDEHDTGEPLPSYKEVLADTQVYQKEFFKLMTAKQDKTIATIDEEVPISPALEDIPSPSFSERTESLTNTSTALVPIRPKSRRTSSMFKMPSFSNTKEQKSFTLQMIMAASSGDASKVQRLLDSGADVDGQDPDHNRTALYRAAESGHPQVVNILLEKKARPDARNNKRSTALMAACLNGDQTIAEQLLQYKASLSAIDEDGRFALLNAAESGNVELVVFLLSNGASVNKLPKGALSTPLICAIRNDKYDVVRVLLDHGANLSVTDAKGFSPLKYALSLAISTSILHLLLDSGASLTANVAANGTRPLFEAVKNNNEQAIRALVEAGADVDLKGREYPDHSKFKDTQHIIFAEDTPLHYAVRFCRVDAVRELLLSGATIDPTRAGLGYEHSKCNNLIQPKTKITPLGLALILPQALPTCLQVTEKEKERAKDKDKDKEKEKDKAKDKAKEKEKEYEYCIGNDWPHMEDVVGYGRAGTWEEIATILTQHGANKSLGEAALTGFGEKRSAWKFGK